MIRMNMDYQNKGKHQWTENLKKIFTGNFSSLIIHTWLCIKQYWQSTSNIYIIMYIQWSYDKYIYNVLYIEPLNIENAIYN